MSWMCKPGIVLGLAVVCSLPLQMAWAENALNEAAKRQTYHVWCGGSADPVGFGSGFLIDQGRRLVTNWHVVECVGSRRRPGGQAVIALSNENLIQLTLEWRSTQKDLAVLKLATALNASVTFASRSALEEREKVIVAGFPGPAFGIDHQVGQVSFTEGIISKFTAIRGVDYIQTTAAAHHGNSGGPLYDEQGRVIGIMVGVAATALEEGQGQVAAAGISYAILADELLVELDRLGIRYEVERTRAETQPSAGAGDQNRQGRESRSEPTPSASSDRPIAREIWIAVCLIAILAVVIIVRARRMQALVQPGSNPARLSAPVYAGPADAGNTPPRLRCLLGPDAGNIVTLGLEPLTLGRDASQSQWVMPRTARKVSRRHCRLRWDGWRQVTLEDCGSANGTFMADGHQLTPGQPVLLKPGDSFYLGSRRFQFRIEWS